MGNEVQEQKILLHLPEKGKEERIVFLEGATYSCAFTLNDTVWEKRDDNLTITGGSEGTLVLQNFFAVSGVGYFVVGNEEILTEDLRNAMCLSSDDFITDIGSALHATELSASVPLQMDGAVIVGVENNKVAQLLDEADSAGTVDKVLSALVPLPQLQGESLPQLHDKCSFTAAVFTDSATPAVTACDATDDEVAFIIMHLV